MQNEKQVIMINRELYINNMKADLPNNVNFNLVWQCASPGELKIYGSGSSTIKLPFTPANDNIFKRARFFNVVSDSGYIEHDCRYYEDCMLLIHGRAYLLQVGESYEVCITWGNEKLIKSMKEAEVQYLPSVDFNWDERALYPFAETSSNSKLPALSWDGGRLMIEPGLTRPIMPYSDVIGNAGIPISSMSADIAEALQGLYVQVNGVKASGSTVYAEYLQGSVYLRCIIFDLLTEDGLRTEEYKTVECHRVGYMEIDEAGGYEIEATNPIGQWDLGGSRGVTLILAAEDYGAAFFAGLKSDEFGLAFQSEDGTEYRRMHVIEDTGSGAEIQGFAQVVALCNVDKQGESVAFFPVGDFSRNAVTLEKGGYSVYVCSTNYYSKWGEDGKPQWGDVDMAGSILAKSIDYKEGFDISNINNPELEGKVKMMTTLGYGTAYDIVGDFMRLFPVFITEVDEKPYIFSLYHVKQNLPIAYDWSDRYVRLDKTGYGNNGMGHKNWCRFAAYDGYAGGNTDAAFKTQTAKGGNVEFVRLERLGNFDRTEQITSYDGEEEIPAYGLGEVEEVGNEDGSISYRQNGIKEMPNILFRLAEGEVLAYDRYGKAYTLARVDGEGVRFEDLFDVEPWRTFISVSKKYRTVTVKAVLRAIDIARFDFRRPVYFKQLAKYFFVTKMTYKGQAESIIEAIEI